MLKTPNFSEIYEKGSSNDLKPEFHYKIYEPYFISNHTILLFNEQSKGQLKRYTLADIIKRFVN